MAQAWAYWMRELADAGTPAERAKPEGQVRGFLWPLNSYWRYQEVEGGVLVECESLPLSRSIPALVALFVRPIVNDVAEESLSRTLISLRHRFAGSVSRFHRGAKSHLSASL